MPTRSPKFNEWLLAERDAQAAEREVYALIIQLARSNAVPPEEKLARAREKRASARGLFPEAMHETRELAHSLHYRHTPTGTGLRPPDDPADAGPADHAALPVPPLI